MIHCSTAVEARGTSVRASYAYARSIGVCCRRAHPFSALWYRCRSRDEKAADEEAEKVAQAATLAAAAKDKSAADAAATAAATASGEGSGTDAAATETAAASADGGGTGATPAAGGLAPAATTDAGEAGGVAFSLSASSQPQSAQPAQTSASQQEKVDIQEVGTYEGKSILEVDPDDFKDRPVTILANGPPRLLQVAPSIAANGPPRLLYMVLLDCFTV
jgi:hypothetical protein